MQTYYVSTTSGGLILDLSCVVYAERSGDKIQVGLSRGGRVIQFVFTTGAAELYSAILTYAVQENGRPE
jgi:hypothetical protein